LTWIVIVLVLLAAFGPIFWMLPSRTDRRLAAMRARARTHGVHVEITQLPDIDADASARVTAGGKRLQPTVTCAAYRLPLRREARAAPQWKLLRNRAVSDGPIDGWQWDSPRVADAAYWQNVAAVLRELPADALACAADARETSCWWRERADAEHAESSVDQLVVSLNKLAEIQMLAHERATADAEDDER
jgi:hypothetical protein